MEKFLEKFINLNFYLSLIPFRVELVKTRNSYGEPVQNYSVRDGPFFHRLFSQGILGLDILQGIFLTRGAYWGKIVEHPCVLFLVWKTIHHSLILGLFWAWTFWKKRKKSDFQKIFTYLQDLYSKRLYPYDSFKDNYEAAKKGPEQNGNLKIWTILLFFGIVFPIVADLVRIFNVDGVRRLPTAEDNFRISSAQILFDLTLVKNHTYIAPTDFTFGYFSISVIYMMLRIWGKILLGMAHVFAFLIAVTFYSEVSRLHYLAFSGKHNFKYIIQHYLRLRRLVHVLNNVNRPILLCLVSASVPLFVLRATRAWDTPQISIKFIVLVKLVQFLIIMGISAEGNDKALSIKTELLELCHQEKDGRAWAGHIFRTDLGLDNGRFVKISYSFIGLMFSAYLSYAIMLLQIQPKSP